MRDSSFILKFDLFAPDPPFTLGLDPSDKFAWSVTDGEGRPLGGARTRAGGRAAVRALYSRRAVANAARHSRSGGWL